MAKGGSFELEVAVELSMWWAGKDDVFYRTPGSGGRFTNRRKAGKTTVNQVGDQLASDPIGQPLMDDWSIECKTGYGTKKKIKDKEGTVVGKETQRWDVLDFLDSRQEKPVLQKMWEQCYRDALAENKEPILIFRRNNREKCIMFRTSYLLYLQNYFGDYIDYHVIVRTNFNCVIVPLKLFFNWIPDIRAALRKKKSTIKLRK